MKFCWIISSVSQIFLSLVVIFVDFINSTACQRLGSNAIFSLAFEAKRLFSFQSCFCLKTFLERRWTCFSLNHNSYNNKFIFVLFSVLVPFYAKAVSVGILGNWKKKKKCGLMMTIMMKMCQPQPQQPMQPQPQPPQQQLSQQPPRPQRRPTPTRPKLLLPPGQPP